MKAQPNIIVLTRDEDGRYRCDIPISREQWIEILRDKSIASPAQKSALLSLFFMPDHKASCAQCAEKYGHTANAYNTGISGFGKAVMKRIGGFSIADESGEIRYWPVAIGIGRNINVGGATQFEWQLRPELVEAIRSYLLDIAVETYLTDFDDHWTNEKYKWQAVQWFQTHWNPDEPNFASMLEWATAKTANLLASMNSFPRGMIVQLAKTAPDDVRQMFLNLYDESIDVATRVSAFMKKAEALRASYNPGEWNMHYQTTNTVSTYLWLRYPDKYYIYKYSEYRSVAEKLGLDFIFKKNGQAAEMVKGFRMYDILNHHLKRNPKAEAILRSRLNGDPNLYADPQLRTMTIDFGFYISRWYESIEQSLFLKSPATMTPFISQAAAILRNKKNLILQGAPGTGKTYHTAALALAIIDGNVPDNHHDIMERYEQLRAENRIGFTTFHQSMDYEDFIEGIKPVYDENAVRYDVESGIFKRICEAATVASEVAEIEKPYVLIIDEINRGNVSKIFGELITLLESDKRLGSTHPVTLSLPYSKQPDFGVPQNLYIIGTMNTTDRSTGTIDYAIRRRFAFVTVPAIRECIGSHRAALLFDAVKAFIRRYKYADMDLDDLMVGHSYFMADSDEDLEMKIRYEVVPLIKEYIKDGILCVKPDEALRHFEAWQRLEPIDDNDTGASED